jgi:riboflavin synthase
MFTGIIQKVAVVIQFTKTSSGPGGKAADGSNPESFELVITNPYAAETKSDPVHLGESIANNGVCLTVTEFSDSHLKFDLSPETIERSSLARLKLGSKVNLERSLRMGDRLSGHWVQGHVDGTARVTEITEVAAGYYDLTIEPTESKLLKYCVKKGSLSVDGISLTIHSLNQKHLKFQIIPHTWAMTCLSDLSIGDLVNIEVDILAKYIERFHEHENESSV